MGSGYFGGIYFAQYAPQFGAADVIVIEVDGAYEPVIAVDGAFESAISVDGSFEPIIELDIWE